jgi:hypothetical protein
MVFKVADTGYPARLLFGFIAGFVATLIFHQLTWWVLWGGLWGIVFSMVHHRFPARSRYWVTAILFGAVLPTMTARLVVAPLKGLPIGSGWHLPLLLTALLANGAWAIGAGLILGILSGRSGRSRVTSA